MPPETTYSKLVQGNKWPNKTQASVRRTTEFSNSFSEMHNYTIKVQVDKTFIMGSILHWIRWLSVQLCLIPARLAGDDHPRWWLRRFSMQLWEVFDSRPLAGRSLGLHTVSPGPGSTMLLCGSRLERVIIICSRRRRGQSRGLGLAGLHNPAGGPQGVPQADRSHHRLDVHLHQGSATPNTPVTSCPLIHSHIFNLTYPCGAGQFSAFVLTCANL